MIGHNYLNDLKQVAKNKWYGGLSRREFQAPGWEHYQMDLKSPFQVLESAESEIVVIDRVLRVLCKVGILNSVLYDKESYLALRTSIEQNFEIPWTAITPRMQRLIYAINAIHRPEVMIAAGVFCGNTFMSNAGAAAGPGAVYQAKALIGLEIDQAVAEGAQRNVDRLDPTGVAQIVAHDALAFCEEFGETIDLLYLDADEEGGRGKKIYLDIAQKAWPKMPSGSLLLAHNSVNSSSEIKEYLEFVRSKENCAGSVNVVIDTEGLEVSVKA